ncbi:MAG: nuclear transport factor 2 family protein [Alphaproteobacteria bacterium]|nr:nuclear transport factor 2 family protein [Alphaproteobacteria bacterium]
MIDADFATTFTRDWVQAWNDHDLERILTHYAEDVVFHSPRIRVVTGRNVDTVTGKTELRAYWGKALGLLRDLYFEVDQVLTGSDALTILYTNERSQSVAETFVFGADGKVVTSIAAYV